MFSHLAEILLDQTERELPAGLPDKDRLMMLWGKRTKVGEESRGECRSCKMRLAVQAPPASGIL